MRTDKTWRQNRNNDDRTRQILDRILWRPMEVMLGWCVSPLDFQMYKSDFWLLDEWFYLHCFFQFCIFSIIQQFGLLFREKFEAIGLTSTQITTIVNTTLATSSCSGLLNGPLFRKFSYRQVAMAGGCLSFLGLFGTIFCNSFIPFLISNSIIFDKLKYFTSRW